MISTLSVFGQPGDPNTNNNSITLQTFAEPPTVTIVPAGVTVTSGSANGSVGTNGTYTVQFFLQNLGTVPSSQLVGALLPGNGVTSPSGPQNYGALAPEGASVGRLYSFTASSSNGGTIVATLQLTNNSTNLGAVSFTFLMPVVQTFSNTAAIYIPNPTNGQGQPNFLEVGQGYPYPSQIAVSGVQGAVSDVTVTISNIAHEFASDVGLLLVGPSNTLNPNGTPCVLMAAAGQQTAISVPVVLTFDQNASSQLPEEYVQIVPGTYQPSDYYTNYYGTAENYSNSLAPVGPYSANLSVFNNFSANGTWSLYAYDFATGDSGEIYNGWSLAITTITPVNLADLAATMISLTNSVNMGNNITNVWTVTNNGPNSTEVFVTNILSPGLTLVTNILPANLISSQSGQTNIFYITNLVPGTGVLVTNVVSTTNATGGLQTNTIIAGSALVDTNLLNNTAFAVTTVVAPPVDLALAPISVNPNTNNSISTNSTLVYTLYVTNNGPSNAFNVVGLFALDGVEFISGGSSAPYPYSLVNGSVQFPLGLMPAGSIAEVTVAAVPTSIGVITNVWSVLTSSSNTNSASNSVSIVLTVTNAMPTIGIGSVTLLSQNQYGSIFANQTNTVLLTLQNTGTGPTSNLVATLQAINGITPITLSGAYGAIYPGASVSQLYTFVGNGVPGAPLSAVWSLKDGTNVLGAVTNTFTLSMLQTFQNSSAIIIPDSGPATPYPSEIQVSGLTNFLVGKVTVTLNGFTHSWPHDVEAFLVSPSGQEIILMEHTGGPYAVSNLVLTFDSAVTASLPSNAPLSAGTFLPTEYTPFDPLPKFLPASSVTSFAAFAGTSPNGIWSLYVYDDTAGNDGVIAHGWSLNLTAVSPVNPTALLSVSSMGTPNPVYVGDYVSYQITVTNAGPGSATNVVLTDTTSNGLAVFVVTNNLGTIQANTSTNVTVQLIVQTNVALTNVAVATTATADLYTPPCTNIISTQVLGAAPMLSASLVGGKVQFTVPGYLGQNYAIQTSTNLRLWSNVSTNTGLFIYTNSLTNSPHRFYRAIQLPH
jgi:uncharacterized repeat protein (TIGR01451 family)